MMLVRSERGILHIAEPTGHGYRGACGSVITSEETHVYRRRDIARAWSLELRCSRCARLAH